MTASWWWMIMLLYLFVIVLLMFGTIFYPRRALEIGPSGVCGMSGTPGTPGGVQGLSWGLFTAPQTTDNSLFLTSSVQLVDVDPASTMIVYSDIAPYDVNLTGFVIHGKWTNPSSVVSETVSGLVYRGDTSYGANGAYVGDPYQSAVIPASSSLQQASVFVPYTYVVPVAQGERLAFNLTTNGCTVNALSVSLVWR